MKGLCSPRRYGTTHAVLLMPPRVKWLAAEELALLCLEDDVSVNFLDSRDYRAHQVRIAIDYCVAKSLFERVIMRL